MKRPAPSRIALAAGGVLALAGLAALPAVCARPATRAAEASPAQPLKDAFLKGRVMGELAMEPLIAAFELGVKVENDIVYLDGTVDSKAERDLVVETVRAVDGVRDVQSGIAVEAGARAAREKGRGVARTLDDAGISAAVKTRLLASSSIDGSAINVDAKDGVVTLKGSVRSEAEKRLAGRIAANTGAAAMVENQLVVSEP